LNYDPTKRLTAAQALFHPFLFPGYFDPYQSFLINQLEQETAVIVQQCEREMASTRERHEASIKVLTASPKFTFLASEAGAKQGYRRIKLKAQDPNTRTTPIIQSPDGCRCKATRKCFRTIRR
jgi:hypothetical protein